jgi:hypothetical protein
MLWKTHLRISFEVMRILNISLSDEVAQSFKNGILAPDHWKDYPHHHGKSEKIKAHLMKSRGCFLQDDFPNAFYNLGVALHYIQDSYTSMASFYPKHDSWEKSIEHAHFTNDLGETIRRSLNGNLYERDRCLQLANILSKEAQGRDNTLYVATLSGHAASRSFAKPIVDLNLALRASYVVAESVLSSKKCPELEAKLTRDLLSYEALMRTAETELSNKIIGLVNERDDLVKRKIPKAGLVCKIRNWTLGMRITFKNSAMKSKCNDYIRKRHLERVVREYVKAANTNVIPYKRWYNYEIPRINQNIVERELLSVQEIAESLGEEERVLKESLNSANISIYYVGSGEMVRRAELRRLPRQFHVKD